MSSCGHFYPGSRGRELSSSWSILRATWASKEETSLETWSPRWLLGQPKEAEFTAREANRGDMTGASCGMRAVGPEEHRAEAETSRRGTLLPLSRGMSPGPVDGHDTDRRLGRRARQPPVGCYGLRVRCES